MKRNPNQRNILFWYNKSDDVTVNNLSAWLANTTHRVVMSLTIVLHYSMSCVIFQFNPNEGSASLVVEIAKR